MSPTTAEGYEQRTRVHLVPRLGHHRLVDLRVGDVDGMLTAVQAEGLSPSTARTLRATLSKALTDATRRELVDRNVAQMSTPPEVDDPDPSAFDVAELAALADVLADHRLWLLYRWIALTGLRASEAVGMRWADVDLDAGTYRVRRGVHRVGRAAARVVGTSGLVESRAKNKASRRPTPLSEPAHELLREQRTAQSRERLAAQVWLDDDLVWTTAVGSLLDTRNVARVLERAVTTAGLEVGARGRGLHELRRTFTTNLLDADVPIHVVQRLGRWASPDVLLRHYAATSDPQLRRAAGQADRT